MSSETSQLHNASASTHVVNYHQINARNFGEFGKILLPHPVTFGSGNLLIDSTFGVYGYCWTHIGATTSFPEFLVGLDMDYMGIKMMGGDFYEYDYSQTRNEIRRHIKRMRRAKELTREEADEEWALSENVSCEFSYYDWLAESKLPDVYGFESGDLLMKVANRQWRGFWEKLWVPLFVPELTKLAQECVTRLEFERQREDARRDYDRWLYNKCAATSEQIGSLDVLE